MRTASVAIILAFATALPGLAADFKVEGRTFTLSDGFTIERVAGPPLVDRPIVADFDERGCLYVADSSGSNDNVKKQLEERTHRIVRLEDTDGDGRFDRRTVFADRMMFPEGAMWYDGSLYVAAPPSIWKLTDADGDGVAERREEWFRGKTLTGCANDLHGPYLGPDGWIYWCKGAFAPQSYRLLDGSTFNTRAAHIFRARPDGTGVEPVMTGGMDNPVEVAFTRGGDLIFTTTFLQHPEGGRRDGLIHAIHGGVYGKVHDVLDGQKRTGPDVMPVLTHLGPAAPSGLIRQSSGAFGTEDGDVLFAAQFNLRKVSRHVLKRHVSTYTTEDSDFLVSPDLDFHPTDVLEDADGSLLVVDTGGWYKLCCPTSQLEKPDVLGAIYRIRAVGAPRVDDPRGLALGWSSATIDDLAARLGDDRPAVRRRAVEALASRGRAALPALRRVVTTAGPPEDRLQAVWCATRIEGAEARTIVRSALLDGNHAVSAAALHCVSLHRDREALPRLLDWPGGGGYPVQRRIAEALGRIGDKSAVPKLLDWLDYPQDRAMEHARIYALIEIADPSSTAAGLDRPEPLVRRGAMIALDQMKGGGLRAETVAGALNCRDNPQNHSAELRETAAWLLGGHPEWGGTLVGLLRERLRYPSLTAVERDELVRLLAQFASGREVQGLLGDTLRDATASPGARRIAIQALGRSGLKAIPGSCVEGLAATLAGDDAMLVGLAVTSIHDLTPQEDRDGALRRGLLAVAAREGLPVEVRLRALAATPGGPGRLSTGLFGLIRRELGPGRPVTMRLLAAEAVARAQLGPEQYRSLSEVIATAGPLEVERLLPAFEATTQEDVGIRLLEALSGSAAFASLRPDMIRPRLAKYGPEVKRRGEELCARLNLDAGKQKTRIDGLLATLPPGEVRRGQAVFHGPKAACLTCHAVGYVGGKLGPDLTAIGATRSDRDLLEAIVYPSLSFVRSFEPVKVATKDGRTLSGLVRKDASDEIVLAVAADKDVRIPREEIEDVQPGNVSLMPAGLDAQLTPQELADLLAFLRSRR